MATASPISVTNVWKKDQIVKSADDELKVSEMNWDATEGRNHIECVFA